MIRNCSLSALPSIRLSRQVATVQNFIGGENVSASDGATLNNVNPANGQVISTIPRSTSVDVEHAVFAASKAQVAWADTPLAARADLLQRVADAINNRTALFDALAVAESTDSGKPLSLSRNVDIPRAVANLKFFASHAQHQTSPSFHTDGVNNKAINLTQRSPLGVVGLITPWNLPIYLLSWKVAPALMAGNAIVAKPSELTPTTASILAETFHECGAPSGLFNVVHGLGAECGAALVNHTAVKGVSFTGGTATGSFVGQAAAKRFIKSSLELGGKNATLVFADKFAGENGSDVLQEVARGVCRAAFLNSGQVCLCGSRILVQESVFEEFVAALEKCTNQLKVGDPFDPSTDLGPVSSHAHRNKVQSYIDLARGEGGRVLCGGKPPAWCTSNEQQEQTKDAGLRGGGVGSGAFLEPTIIADLDPFTSRAATEEIFGPVATVHSFVDEKHALEIANATSYGLSASVWTNNLERAHRVSSGLDVGMVWVNTWLHRDLRTAFGGVKESGMGREGGDYSLEFFSEVKNVCIALDQRPQPMPGAMM